MLVKKCLGGNVAPTFVEYFKFRDRGVSTRNSKISVELPSVKLSFARNGSGPNYLSLFLWLLDK